MADSKLPPGMRSAREVACQCWAIPPITEHSHPCNVITRAVEADRDAWRQRIAEVEADNVRLRAELAAAEGKLREARASALEQAERAACDIWTRGHGDTVRRGADVVFALGRMAREARALASRTTNTEGSKA